MKKLILMTFLASILFTGCSKKTTETKWVNANIGLRLRMEPFIESKQIELIPDGEQVILLKENKDEVFIDNKKGKWVQIKWKEKIGWAFDAFLSNQNLARWITTKTGLPYLDRISTRRGRIPFQGKVKLIGSAKLENYVIVNWHGSNVEVRGEFLSDNVDISYNFPDLRKVASIQLAINPKYKIYPEDMYIEANNWLYHIIYIYGSQDFEYDYLESLWIKEGNKWKQIRPSTSSIVEPKIKMFNLDEDDNPDLLMYGGCCDRFTVEVLLGTSDKKLSTIFEAHGVDYPENFNSAKKEEPDSPIIISSEKCDKTIIEFKKKKFVFDCNKKKFI